MRLLTKGQKYLQVLYVNTVLNVLLMRPYFVISIFFTTLSNFYEFNKKLPVLPFANKLDITPASA